MAARVDVPESCSTVDSPTRRRLLQLAAASALPPGLAGCGGGSDVDLNSQLRQALQDAWKARYPTRHGGLTLQVICPKGEYFASTLEGVTADSWFRGASTTKTFTAAAIMLLDQRKLLRIEDKLTAPMPGRGEPYLPPSDDYAIPDKGDISIQQLLSHWAGVFDVANQQVPSGKPVPYAGAIYTDWRIAQDPFHTFTKDELVGVVAASQLSNASPGAIFKYSDTHYTLLGRIVERVSGLPLDVFLQRELLLPNALARTHFVTDGRETRLPSPSIAGYALEGGVERSANDFNYSYDPGSGNVFTTPADLTRWIRRLLRGEAGVNIEQVNRMIEPEKGNAYGLGLFPKLAGATRLGYGHNGGCSGYYTDAFHDRELDVSYVLQCSLIDFDAFGAEIDWMGRTALAARGILGY